MHRFAQRELGPMLGMRRDTHHRVVAEPRAQAIDERHQRGVRFVAR